MQSLTCVDWCLLSSSKLYLVIGGWEDFFGVVLWWIIRKNNKSPTQSKMDELFRVTKMRIPLKLNDNSKLGIYSDYCVGGSNWIYLNAILLFIVAGMEKLVRSTHNFSLGRIQKQWLNYPEPRLQFLGCQNRKNLWLDLSLGPFFSSCAVHVIR